MRVIHLLALGLTTLLGASGILAQEAQQALFLSGTHTLQGAVYKPEGKGPFPAVIFNQRIETKEHNKAQAAPFAQLAGMFVNQGYVFFVPGIHSLGQEEDNEIKPENSQARDEQDRNYVEKQEHHARNVAAALGWLRAQIYVDETRVAMIGDGSGAITTLVAGEKEPGLRGLIVFSPGVTRLQSNHVLRDRLGNAIQQSKAPVFLIQAQNDYNLSPKNIFGPILEKKGGLNRVRIYPPYGDGPKEAHRLFLQDYRVWQRDVFAFLHQAIERTGTVAATEESLGTQKNQQRDSN